MLSWSLMPVCTQNNFHVAFFFAPRFMFACLLLPLTIDVYHYFCSHFCYILIACYQTGNEKFRYSGEKEKSQTIHFFHFYLPFVSSHACNIFSNILLWSGPMGNWFYDFLCSSKHVDVWSWKNYSWGIY